MVNLTQATRSVSEKDIKRDWHLIDLKDEVLGRAASKIAGLLQGKSKVNYVPYLDMGDNVVVVNSKQVKVTGNKRAAKTYDSYSGYPGGRRVTTFDRLIKKNPTEVIRQAVSGMLPKNKLRDRRLTRLFVFPDKNHTFADKLKIVTKE